MADLVVNLTAQEEIEEAKRIIFRYFKNLDDIQKGYAWIEVFIDELESAYIEIEKDPFHFPLCTLYPLNDSRYKLRYFTAGWFTVFYTWDQKTAIIRHVVSSSSDFSNVVPIHP